MNKLKYVLQFPILFAAQILYRHTEYKHLIDEDMNKINECSKRKRSLMRLLSDDTYFRCLFYFRLGNKGKVLNYFLPKNPLLMISPLTDIKGGGILCTPLCNNNKCQINWSKF